MFGSEAVIMFLMLNRFVIKYSQSFKHLALFSCGLYSSHHYLVAEAYYLKFINNATVEYSV